jgi:CRP/FNR family transcriptional regulator, cyclic AMP receptor protein
MDLTAGRVPFDIAPATAAGVLGFNAMARPPHSHPHQSLLDLDPELGQLLDEERRQAAQRDLRARVTAVPIGEWDGARLAATDPGNVGLLVLEGVMAREVVVGDTVSTELLGPGDVVRPWQLAGDAGLLQVSVRWNALSKLRLAVLDRRVAAVLAQYPEVNAVLIDRLSERAQRLAVGQAISQLHRVDVRLVSLLWHLAERWGRVTGEGVVVPLALSHRVLGQLVGARRPTVSTALAQLARENRVERRADGTWLLLGEPEGVTVDSAEIVRQRRRLMPETAAQPEPALRSAPMAAAPPPAAAEINESLRVLRERALDRGRVLRELCETASSLHARTMVIRAESAAARARRAAPR